MPCCIPQHTFTFCMQGLSWYAAKQHQDAEGDHAGACLHPMLHTGTGRQRPCWDRSGKNAEKGTSADQLEHVHIPMVTRGLQGFTASMTNTAGDHALTAAQSEHDEVSTRRMMCAIARA